MSAAPTFGVHLPGRRYALRPAVYAVIRRDDGCVATVKGRRLYSLPGGGLEPGETPEQGLEREVREECACAVAIGKRIGCAVQWFENLEGAFQGRHVYFEARFASDPEGEGEHELLWLDLETARERLMHRAHVWAIEAARENWFAAMHDAIAKHYLAEPDNPYRGSGRSSGAARWEETRRCYVEAVHKDGDFVDVGCANGLLLETLAGWCAERGRRIRPHGVDFVAELLEHARVRHPGHEGSFEVANAFHWQPRRRYDFVRANIESVPDPDRPELARRLFERAVADGGRLILAHYAAPPDRLVDVAEFMAGLGYRVAGSASAPNASLAWTDKS